MRFETVTSLAIVSCAIAACGGSGSSQQTQPIEPELRPQPVLKSFSLLASNNAELETDLEFNLVGSTFSARIPDDASVESLGPTFTFEGSRVVSSGVTQISGETRQDFTQILTYQVSNQVGATKSYSVDLNRFTGLPIIYLTTDEPVTSKEEYVNGKFRLDGWRNYESVDEMEMKIRGRGNSTWAHPKKPYQIKLDSKRSLLGMEEDKKWLLLAEYSDKSLLRNHLAFYLSSRTTLRWTPSGRFAEVFMNGKHDGVYHVTEKVEEGSNRVNIGETGFLLEIDQPDRLDPDDVFFRTSTYLVNVKEPSLDYGDPEFEQIRQHINDFEDVLLGESFKDPVNGYAAYIDVDSFVDWFLVNEIAKNVDAQWYSSIFLHYVPGDKIYMGPIWDFDLGFGNVDYADATYPERWWVRWNTWISRMLEDPAFVLKVKERFASLDAQRPDTIKNIRTWSDELSLAQAQNDAIWQTLGRYVWPNPIFYDTYEQEVEHLVDWFDTRMDWLAEAIADL